MKVIVVGCGRVGSTLAYQLYQKGNQVVVIDKNASAFDNLPNDFHGRMIEGDVLARNTLHRAEIEQADALATVTNSDTLNALVAHVARSEFHVSRVIARNYDPRQRPLQDAFDIPIIGSASWGAQRIEEFLSESPLRAAFLDGNHKVAIYQLAVPESWHGRTLKDLIPENQVKTIAFLRDGLLLDVSPTQTLERGDLIYMYAGVEEIEALQQRLGLQQELQT